MADKIFVARNGLVANGTFLANSTVVNAAAVTATSVNATTLSISGTSVATLITGNAATAYTNGTAYADARAANAYTNAIALSGNATNLTTGILPMARLDANVVNTSGSFTITGPYTFNGNLIFGAAGRLSANGSFGTAGQLLSSNGSGVYWADLGSVGTNTATPYSWTNTHVFSNTVTVNNSTFSVGSATVNTTITLGTITLSNGAAVATVNSTVYNGTANNASFFNGQSGSFYTNATNITSGTLAAARLSGTYNITVTTATNATNVSNASSLSTGTVPTARLGTGTASSTTFLSGDQSYKTAVTSVATGAGLTGGTITGTGTVSVLANTGVVANATGVHIGQAVATTSNVQFRSIGVGTTPSGTSGDITITQTLAVTNSGRSSTLSTDSLTFTSSGESLFQSSTTGTSPGTGGINLAAGGTARFRATSTQCTSLVDFNTIGNIISTGGQIWSTLGFRVKAGTSGSLGTQSFNISWDNTNASLWIDNTNVGVIASLSDRRIKHEIENISSATETVMALRPVTYRWRNEGLFRDDGVSRWGFIADEVQAVIPSAVVGNADDVNADGLIQPQHVVDRPIIAALTKALQEAITQLNATQTRLAAAEERLTALEGS